jgi:hypothetical protein
MLLDGRGTRYSPFERNVPASTETCYDISNSNLGLKCAFYYQHSLLQVLKIVYQELELTILSVRLHENEDIINKNLSTSISYQFL